MARLLLTASLTILLSLVAHGAPSPTPAPKPVPSPTPILDGLGEADLERALTLLREHYVNPGLLKGTEIKRATLAGLLERLDRGAILLPARSKDAATPAPFYREILGGHIGYLRPGDLSKVQLEELDTTLRAFDGKKVDAIILDLRGSVQTNDYVAAAGFAQRFVPKGKPLFALKGAAGKPAQDFTSDRAPLYPGLIVVLIDGETAGATEVLSAVLRLQDHAILVGEGTAGQAVDYSDLPLPSGNILRVAVAEAVLPEAPARYPDGISPDLTVKLPVSVKRQVFAQSLTTSMAPFVYEDDRPHLNEAALLAGTNPEIEAAQEAQQRRASGKPPPPALHDAVLQRGVDLVTSIEVYEKQTNPAP
ncbi:MAG: S41 family peptidase [Chthoniobacterales bacterium]